jgi:hypothetical protein
MSENSTQGKDFFSVLKSDLDQFKNINLDFNTKSTILFCI